MSASSSSNDLRNRIIFTIAILTVYRFGTFVPLPGIDPEQLKIMMEGNQKGLLGMFNVFAGGAISRMAIFALGIMPYISSSIIVQLLTGVSDYFKNLKAQGEIGRSKITQITRYGTVLLATVQGYGLAVGLESSANLVINPGLFFKISTVTTIVAGTIFLMWLGEQITQRGIGNGISLIIFAGIVAEIPRALVTTFELGRTGAVSTLMILAIFILLILTILFIVFMERALRKILINYPKRQMGNKMYGGESSHLPLKINQAGVIPAIFASALLLLPVTFSNFNFSENDTFLNISSYFTQGQPLYMLLYASGIIFFTFFYTSITFNPTETADNLRKYGGFIPGIRPGESTAIYIENILTKLTTIGALYLTLVCLMPEFLIANYPIPFYLGGTSILIVVVVAIDTVTQIQTRLMSSQYEQLIKKTKFGTPGAGKGTQSKYLVEKIKGFQISTGDMLREEIQNQSEIGKKIINDMNDGKFVSDEIVNNLIKGVIFDPKKKNKLIFDGYPRSISQAENLDKLLKTSGQKIDLIFFLNVSKDIIIKRIEKRKAIENRSDDDLNTILKRFDTYMETTKPVLNYYSKNSNFHEIDGAQEIDQITNKIEAFLEV
jgi:preprotein translocase subunit SecY